MRNLLFRKSIMPTVPVLASGICEFGQVAQQTRLGDEPLNVKKAIQRRFRLSRPTFVLSITLGLLSTSFARERGPRVEVVCPVPPIPVTIGKNKVLVYELHVTNFDVVPLTLQRVSIFTAHEHPEQIATLEEESLSAAMTRVGTPMVAQGGSKAGEQDARTIISGGRSVVFLWIEFPINRQIPSNLRHRLVFSSSPAGTDKPIEATLEDFLVPINQGRVPILSPPFRGGIWVAGDGPANGSNHRRSIFAIDGYIYSPERFAIDWDKIGSNRDTRHNGNTKNENWWGWGEPILAVADGEVTEAVDEFPDNTPGILPPVTLDNIAGNHIILRITQNRFVGYAHLQRGSIKVRTGDHVHRGDVLGLLGNSGNSTAPHLHFQVTDHKSFLQSQGVPFVFAGFTYLGSGSDYPQKQVSMPQVNSLPPGNGVVSFLAVKK
jgi:murein DD-endopeptidase